MSSNINPIQKRIVKEALLQRKTAKQALKLANYSPNYQHKSTQAKVVKVCLAEIDKDIKAKITVESVLNGIHTIEELAITSGDYGTARSCEELKGKWLQMWDKAQSNNVIIINNQDRGILDNYIDAKSLPQDSAQPTKLT